MDVATPVISPGRPVDSTLNDNYCWIDPHSELTVEDPIVQDMNQNVSLHVVCRASCVTGLSENKDINPNQAQKFSFSILWQSQSSGGNSTDTLPVFLGCLPFQGLSDLSPSETESSKSGM